MPETEPKKPTILQEKWGIPRAYWLPLLAFAGGSLIFLLVDVLCYYLSRLGGQPPGF